MKIKDPESHSRMQNTEQKLCPLLWRYRYRYRFKDRCMTTKLGVETNDIDNVTVKANGTFRRPWTPLTLDKTMNTRAKLLSRFHGVEITTLSNVVGAGLGIVGLLDELTLHPRR